MSRELASIARRLNRETRAGALPALFFVTDRGRTPDPGAVARRLPRGTAIIYRHFGAADRYQVAAALAGISRRRGLILLIAADPALARAARAGGVHLPERMAHLAPRLRRRGWIITASAHGPRGLLRARGADGALLSTVFASRSATAGAPLGPLRAGQLARAAGIPVIALGGISARTARRLPGRGFAGLAAVEGLAD